ncbi:OPT/YSL family transporter [Candidatus Sumerlaeota bacterium]|nr:OPT/YSL family transporter [Candidatus Sumerlaeota bacterium]
MMREDREFQEFRDLMQRPDKYEDGFNLRTVIMALFVGILMTPAQMYMQLVAGIEMGSAAQWVTVILYVEVARRSFTKLKRPEIFVLFYMCGAVIHSPGQDLLWRQFIVQSEEFRKMGIIEFIPSWYAPNDPDVLGQRSFWKIQWMLPIGIAIFTMFIQRLDHFGLGYVMYRLTADVEDLPFPMAPVQAMGMTALADASDQKDTWRWRTFSYGAMAGVAFGAIYLAVPNITSAIFSEGLRILPLPFVDLTGYTERYLPAMPVLASFDLTFFVTGMVLPFWAMVGSFIGLLFTLVFNPLLYKVGVLDSWREGVGAIQTIQSNTMDFYLSFSIGLGLAVAVIGIMHMMSKYKEKKREFADQGSPKMQWSKLFETPKGRGDIPIWVALGIYLFSTCSYIALGYWLINVASPTFEGTKFPLWLLMFYGFVYTPVISYVSTRMEGIVGQQVGIPFVREATFILSGYKGAAVWFAPIPMYDYARQAQFFKTTELTGTKFTSLIKTEILIFPIMMVGMMLFSQFIWSIDNVPSELFPYANEFWELRAYQQGLIFTSTLPGEAASPFREAFNPYYLGLGFALALAVYTVLAHFGLPIFLVYGVVRGLDQSVPHAIIPMFIGALVGRFGCRKWFGDLWPQYRIVFAAGFVAGVGLISMFSLGIVFMSKSVIKLPM